MNEKQIAREIVTAIRDELRAHRGNFRNSWSGGVDRDEIEEVCRAAVERVISLRLSAWRSLGAESPVPRSLPTVTAEDQPA